jgi:hypothetical protein
MGSVGKFVVESRNFRINPVTAQELTECRWYAVPNDLIGGWDISNVNKPESQRNPYGEEFEIGSFLTEEVAQHIVDVHNTWWEIEVWKSYSYNIWTSHKQTVNREVSHILKKLRPVLDKLKPFD